MMSPFLGVVEGSIMFTIQPIMAGKYKWGVFDEENWLIEKFVTEDEARRYCQLANEDEQELEDDYASTN